ncbi:hypothetical protein [Clostridium gasigenes]|nr:hypothetical protein [Clostridium gasigenes]MBB6621829.1 cell division protein FtsL [Clostridium gasigenes]MBB6716308.1 cell division protein FtsL [Clostridium gasigenes]MBU3087335.1 cell division protein FtsL [Clostridium gasigenes]MBU3102864.1 cell division protein FtsL [Clostridium gasigenes]MBU3106574.1 cell division protein FtsL [Clostridium gasigenes]
MEKEYDYIRGNMAINPDRKYEDFNDDQRKKDLERAEKEKRKKIMALRDKKTKNIIQVALVICVLGVITVMRDGKVYKTQKKLTDMRYEVKNAVAANEALRVDFLKFSSLDNVKAAAKSMGMTNPNNNEAITVDMTKNYFPELTENSIIKKEKDTLFSKLMGAIKK